MGTLDARPYPLCFGDGTWQVLSMVEEGNLDVGGNSPQKLCLVAICYHNMAVSGRQASLSSLNEDKATIAARAGQSV